MSRFMAARYAALDEYVPGEQPQDRQYIKLNTNESPYPPAPAVCEAVGREELAALRLYSDPDCRTLKTALARAYSVAPQQVFVSNGSDDILNFAFMAFAASGRICFPEISYGFYEVFARLHGLEADKIPLAADFTINPADYFRRGAMIAIANPNAPTGLALTRAQIEGILRENPDQLVLIDEAYVDFGAESCLPLLEAYDNLLVVMTYSKSRSLAGARLGFAFSSPEIIRDLEKIKFSTNPYSINRLTLACGAAALEEPAYYRDACAKIIATRERTAQALREMGFFVLASRANFLFAKKPGIPGETIYQKLKARGILVRHFSNEKISDYNRISIGTDADMAALLSALSEIIQEETL